MKTKMMPIKACAEVLPGFSTKLAVSHDPGGSHQLVLAKHLPPDGPYRYNEAHALLITPDRPVEKYLLAPGYVLFMSRGARNRAVMLESLRQPSIVPISFYILRPRTVVIPEYLAWCINQIPMQSKITEIRTGAGTPLVNRKAFSDLQIAVPPIEKQKKIATLARLMDQEKRLLGQMAEEVERLHRVIGQNLLKKLEDQSLIKD